MKKLLNRPKWVEQLYKLYQIKNKWFLIEINKLYTEKIMLTVGPMQFFPEVVSTLTKSVETAFVFIKLMTVLYGCLWCFCHDCWTLPTLLSNTDFLDYWDVIVEEIRKGYLSKMPSLKLFSWTVILVNIEKGKSFIFARMFKCSYCNFWKTKQN